MMPEILVIFLSNFWIYSCEILLLQSLKLNGGASSALVLLSSPLLKDLDVRSKRKTVVVVSFCCSFLESATYSLLLIMNELDLCGTRWHRNTRVTSKMRAVCVLCVVRCYYQKVQKPKSPAPSKSLFVASKCEVSVRFTVAAQCFGFGFNLRKWYWTL